MKKWKKFQVHNQRRRSGILLIYISLRAKTTTPLTIGYALFCTSHSLFLSNLHTHLLVVNGWVSVFFVFLFALALMSLVFLLFPSLSLSYAFQCGSDRWSPHTPTTTIWWWRKIIKLITRVAKNEPTKMIEREKKKHEQAPPTPKPIFFQINSLLRWSWKRKGLWFSSKLKGTNTLAQSIESMHFADG